MIYGVYVGKCLIYSVCKDGGVITWPISIRVKLKFPTTTFIDNSIANNSF